MSWTALCALARAKQGRSSIFRLLFAHHKRGSMKRVKPISMWIWNWQYIAPALERLSGTAHSLQLPSWANSLPQAGQEDGQERSSSFFGFSLGTTKEVRWKGCLYLYGMWYDMIRKVVECKEKESPLAVYFLLSGQPAPASYNSSLKEIL
jgi:hypothetical protein